MAEFQFVKNYADTILVSESEQDDFRMLLEAGYKPNEDGEIEVDMLFGDGIAYDTSMNGIVMRYPTLYEVSQSEKMQREIYNHCGERVCDHYEQWDVALTYGKVGRYKYVLDYNEWVEQGENCIKDICTLYRGEDDTDLNHCLDCFEDEYNAMFDKGYIPISDSDDGHTLREGLSNNEIYALQTEYGILWTESLGTHKYDEQGYLRKVA